ncbi:hypothetical protein Tco_1421506, partial [Tanacetum coccineum]
ARVAARPSSSDSSLSSYSISIPSTEIVGTSIIPALSTEFTTTPRVLSTAPVHVTSTTITSTTPTPRLTDGCNRVTARKRFRHPPVGRLGPLVPSSHPSRSSSSSSEGSSHSPSDTSHTLSGPLPHRRHWCLDYDTPSQTSSVGPSRNRRRSFVTSVTTTAHTPAALAPARADLLLICKRFRGSTFDYKASVEDGMEADGETGSEADVRIDVEDGAYTKDYDTNIGADITADAEADAQIGVEAEIEAEAEVEESDGDTIEIGVDVVHPDPDTPAVFPMSTSVVRLVEHEEAIQGMREHLLEMPTQRLKEIKEELRVQGEREDVSRAEGITLRARVRSLKIIESRLRDIVRGEREARARIERHLDLVQKELRQSRMSYHHD